MTEITKKCQECKNVTVASNRHLYCDPCKKKVQSKAARSKQDRRLKGCLDCGADNFGQGSRFCLECKEKRLPLWQQAELERSRRRRAAEALLKKENPKKCEICNEENLPSFKYKFCETCRINKKSNSKTVSIVKTKTQEEYIAQAELNRERSREYERKKRAKRIADGEQVELFIDDTKWCSRCESYKIFTDFGTNSRVSSGLQTYCLVCNYDYSFERRVKSVYGITAEEYDQLLNDQDRQCYICKNKPRKQRLAVDHDHVTGAVRGLLCTRCNHKLLGAAHDNIEILQRAIDYLLSPPAIKYGYVVPEQPRKKRSKK